MLLPELDQRALYDSLRPLTTPRGMLPAAVVPLLQTELPVVWCPSYPAVETPTTSGEPRTTYLGSSDLFSKRMSLSDVVDGDSQTLAFGETTADQSWSRPGLGQPGGGPNAGSFASHHPGGVQVVLCDGQSRFIGENVDAAAFSALCTPQGRDVANID